MSNSKGTKRSLLASLTSLLLCVAMLIGSTFAWFTDTASTAVNKIQAGNLDVELWQGSTDKALDTAALKWVKAADGADQDVLWEPGATYNLESFRIKNNGDLDLKYKVIISGLVGSAKLLNAIDFTVSVTEGNLTAKDGTSSVSTVANLNGFEGTLEAGAVTGAITITGKMKTDAGNEYQGLSIDGIGITVIATQAQGEYDSVNNTYDADAQYPVYVVQDVTVEDVLTNGVVTAAKVTAESTVATEKKVSEAADAAPVAQAKVAKDTVLEAGTTQVKLSIKDVAASEANVTVQTTDTQAAKTLEVKLEGLSPSNTTPVIVTMYVGKDLNGFQLYHTEDNGAGTESTQMTSVNSVDLVKSHNEYYYDRATGFVTMATKSFSPFTYVYNKPLEVSTFEQFITALDKADAGDTIKLTGTIDPTTNFTFDKSVIIDMNGYGFVRGAEESGGYSIKVLPNCDLTMRDGTWTIDEKAGFGKITVEQGSSGCVENAINNIVFENVSFINNMPVTAGGSSSNGIEEVVKVNMSQGMTVNAEFTNCTFENAKVYFSALESNNTFHATFEGCKFNNLGNTSSIHDDCLKNYVSDDCSITVKNCEFNIVSTSGVYVVEGRQNAVALTFTSNTVNGSSAGNSQYKVLNPHLTVYNSSFKTVNCENNTLTGITKEK